MRVVPATLTLSSLSLLLWACSDDSAPATDSSVEETDVVEEIADDETDVEADSGDDPTQVVYSEEREVCADRNPQRNPYFGDLHVHTAYSFDAYAFGTRHEPAAAYRFAQGEQLMLLPNDDEGNPTQAQQLRTPLDFAALRVSRCRQPLLRARFRGL